MRLAVAGGFVLLIIGLFFQLSYPAKQVLTDTTRRYITHTELSPPPETAQKTQSTSLADETGTPTAYEETVVVKVIDGDTITVRLNGKNEKVRLIGINSLETVDPRKNIQCLGKQATTYLARLLNNQHISLAKDAKQADKDQYNRLLRYIFLSDGTLVNDRMIRDGYAYEYTYQMPYQYQEQFQKDQAEARLEGRGLWNAKTCNGNL